MDLSTDSNSYIIYLSCGHVCVSVCAYDHVAKIYQNKILIENTLLAQKQLNKFPWQDFLHLIFFLNFRFIFCASGTSNISILYFLR